MRSVERLISGQVTMVPVTYRVDILNPTRWLCGNIYVLVRKTSLIRRYRVGEVLYALVAVHFGHEEGGNGSSPSAAMQSDAALCNKEAPGCPI